MMNRCIGNGFDSSADLSDPRISVLMNTSFEGLPPCLLIVAELDPLRDDSLRMRKYKQISVYVYLIF